MVKTIKTSTWLPALRNTFFVAGFAFLAIVIIFCCFYLCSGYNFLVMWYMNLDSCFYHSTLWSSDFFTPRIKSIGNIWCVTAILIAVAGCWSLWKCKKTFSPNSVTVTSVNYDTRDVLPLILAVVTSVALWAWGNHLSLPAYDEVFSAQNAAGIHPFQCISYYMLPNNHLFFNLLNSLVFHAADDKVMTGRIISLFAYCSLVVILFFWFKQLVADCWLSLLICVTLALQFPTWGFSFQARGYEWYLLAEWGMVISLFSYLSTSRKNWLYLNAICCAIGYFCLPSFLYLHVAQLVFMLFYYLLYKRPVAAFWSAQLAALSLTFLFYLPALCFSGIGAIAGNDYVSPLTFFKTASESAFLQWMFPAFMPNITDIFSDLRLNGISMNMVLFFLPLLLLLDRKNKMNALFGLFYVCMWVVFLSIAIVMRRLPFERNLIGQHSITLSAVLLFIYWAMGFKVAEGKTTVSRRFIYPAVLLILSIHYFNTNNSRLKKGLYEFDVNETCTSVTRDLEFIPPGSTAAFSDVGFYCYYLCHKKGVITSKCANGHETYYIRQRDDALPQIISENYVLLNRFDQYEAYKHK